jgi:hypothetical protein
MKKIAIITLLFLSGISFAQQTFIRQNGTTTTYSSISSVFTAAVDNDTIYIPGGAFNINTLTINKKLHVFGVGHHPDSTQATYATTLTGNIVILGTGSYGSIEGVYLTGYLRFGSSSLNQTVTNYNISRCSVENIEMGYDYNTAGTASYINVKDNIIRTVIRGCNAQFVNIENNLIQGSVEFFNGNTLVKNNTFIKGNGCPSYHMNMLTSVTFENNIFMNYSSCGNVTITGANSCIFQSNVFNGTYTFPVGTNIGSGNYVTVSHTGFFLNENNFNFEYSDNYHLSNPSSYLGNNGTETGMYGGSNPYKEGGVPRNPHIITKSIAPQTTPTGDLNINIQVGAQQN